MAANRDLALAQIIGIEQGVRADTEPWWKHTRETVKNDTFLIGTDVSYEARDGFVPEPRKARQVQVNTTEVIAQFREKMGRYLDVTATKDWGNMGDGGARADVILDGETILAAVPATFLLFLEKRLAEWQGDFRRIPAQSAAEDWHPSTDPGIWRTAKIEVPTTTRVTAFEVPVGPTPEHRAEVREVSKDVITGTKTTVHSTSALPATQLRQVLDAIARLREAVQVAIHDANRITVADVKVSGVILGAIFGDAAAS